MTLQGRKTPPSEDELRAAGEAGAMWVGTRPVVQNLMGTERPRMTAVLSSSPGYSMGLHYDEDRPATRWFYIEPDGTMPIRLAHHGARGHRFPASGSETWPGGLTRRVRPRARGAVRGGHGTLARWVRWARVGQWRGQRG